VNNNEIPQTGEPGGVPTRCQANPSNRILVVDDDRDLCQLSADVLGRSGYQVDTAGDGSAGWEALLANNYDLLITDNRMPKISGVELVKKLRSARMTLPVVLASSLIPTEDLSRNPSLQLAATLLKPFTCAELVGTVKNVLGPVDGARCGAEIHFPVTGAVPSRQI
jgi:DNA-binding response OmpR family regulator